MNEFELINAYFMHCDANGDDAAIIDVQPSNMLLTSIDTLVAGRHFLESADPFDIGFKSLAVSISDLAAMGAAPASFLLSLSLPALNETWIAAFSKGLYNIADQFGMQHIGGDITRGPLTISSVVFGHTPKNQILKRSGAKIGDNVYVSGSIGNAGAALHNKSLDQTRLNRPQPRVELGIALRDIATSCIDISDGLAQDLRHILKASKVGATLSAQTIPCNCALKLALTAGDDYELCFTAGPSQHAQLQALSKQLNLPITCIGSITSNLGLEVVGAEGVLIESEFDGYQHF